MSGPHGVEGGAERIGAALQIVEARGGDRALPDQTLDRRFEAVRQLAQTHRPGQPGAALEGVQGAHAGGRRTRVGRRTLPFGHLGRQLR